MEYLNKWHLIKKLFLIRQILICILFQTTTQQKWTMILEGQKQKSEFNE